MPLTPYLKREMLNVPALPSTVFAALHTAEPSQGTPHEVSGGSPLYARIPVSLPFLLAGQFGPRVATGLPGVWNVPPGTVITHIGYWDAASGGNLLAYYDVGDEIFTNQGRAELDSLSINAADVVGG